MRKHSITILLRERELIIYHHQKGKFIRVIAAIIQKTTVQHVIESFKKEARLINKVRKGLQ